MIVRITARTMLSFDVEVPDDDDSTEARHLARLNLQDTADWFDSLTLTTILGEGNMALKWDGERFFGEEVDSPTRRSWHSNL